MHNVYLKYYTLQEGGGISGGGDGGVGSNGGVNYDEHFGKLLNAPHIYQKGRGIGGFLKGIWKFLKPLMNSGANFIKNEAVSTGADLLKGIANQKPLKQVLLDRSVQVVDNLRDSTVNKIKKMSGSGRLTQVISKKRKHSKSKRINTGSKRKYNQSNAKSRNAKLCKTKYHLIKKQPRIIDIFT